MIIRFPRTFGQAVSSPGEFRAGGTDLAERHASGVAGGPIVDLRDLDVPGAGLRAIAPTDEGGVRMGALVTLAQAVASDLVRAAAPGLVQALENAATPQVRAVGTLGGNLMQRVRCWYFRHPDVACLKKGGTHCYARVGDHRQHSCIDLGPCLAPHPSTVALALLAYDGLVETHEGGVRGMEAFFGDGADPFRENALEARELVTALILPPGRPEGAAYVRAKERAGSEWPLVDAVVRVQQERERTVSDVRVVIGHAANRSIRLRAVEEVLRGRVPDVDVIAEAAAAATDGVTAPVMTSYKLPIVRGVVQSALELAVARGAAL